MYTGVCAFEIPAEVLGKRLDSRFGGIVGGVAGRVRDSLLATRDDDRGWLRLGGLLNDREECSNAMDDAKNVSLKNLIASR